VILRVAGIYGPGRGHWFKSFLRGDARIEGDGARWLNMIHRDDLIGVIIAALRDAPPGEIFNAVDNEPVSQRHFFGWLAAELKAPAANRAGRCGSLAQARRHEQAREQREAAKMELGIPFQFPDFRAGYAAELLRPG
jgi:nucleoside-diphosphate-sugar epimerase